VTPIALALVLTAAVIHASWNVLIKRVGGGIPFIWLFDAGSTIIYAPLLAGWLLWQHPVIGELAPVFILGTGVLHIAYFIFLQRGYRTGDLSLVYPLARGTGPLLATAIAISLFGERPSRIALTGALLVAGSVALIAGGARRAGADARKAALYGLLTGVTIAMYTLWDKQAVSRAAVPPLLLLWGSTAIRLFLLTPIAIRRGPAIRHHWEKHRWELLGVAALGPLSYLLVLTALVTTPVSYVAPTREVSVIFGAYLGSRLLSEAQATRRLVAAVGMAVGIIALAVG
jgi:drug/metabolite transporter (DMT)-like permease